MIAGSETHVMFRCIIIMLVIYLVHLETPGRLQFWKTVAPETTGFYNIFFLLFKYLADNIFTFHPIFVTLHVAPISIPCMMVTPQFCNYYSIESFSWTFNNEFSVRDKPYSFTHFIC